MKNVKFKMQKIDLISQLSITTTYFTFFILHFALKIAICWRNI